MPKKSIYIPEKIDEEIISASETDSYSARVAHLVTLAAEVGKEAAPALTQNQWLAVADALNGHWPSYESGPARVFKSAWHSLFDAAPELDEKWGVDCETLARKLAEMPLAAQAGVFEIARAFWVRPPEDQSNYRVMLEALGANITE